MPRLRRDRLGALRQLGKPPLTLPPKVGNGIGSALAGHYETNQNAVEQSRTKCVRGLRAPRPRQAPNNLAAADSLPLRTLLLQIGFPSQSANADFRRSLQSARFGTRLERAFYGSYLIPMCYKSLSRLARVPLIGNCASKDFAMLSWTLTFLVVALLSALLGFSGVAGTATGIAKIMFGLFLVIFLVSAFRGKHV